jgi:hypothetical protein
MIDKFEQLIEYVVNDEEDKAKELFHEIVIEKSRTIYEDIMSEEELSEDDLDEAKKQGYDDEEDESLGMRTGKESGKKQSMKARRDDSYGKFGKRDKEDRKISKESVDEAQGYDDEEDESLGMRTGKESGKKQSMKARRDDSYGKFGKRDEEHREISKEGVDEAIEEELGGDAAADLIDDIEVEEQGLAYEAEEEIDIDIDDEGEEELEDRVVDLEDKLDELMAEFEAMMDEPEDEVEVDDIEINVNDDDDDVDVEVDDEEFETEGYEAFNENVDLVAAPKPDLKEPAGTNTKSPNAANSGAKGAAAHPVDFDDGNSGKEGRPTPKYGDMQGTTKPDVKPATKPDLAQASGVNTKSVID